jgi:hypothetical protein
MKMLNEQGYVIQSEYSIERGGKNIHGLSFTIETDEVVLGIHPEANYIQIVDVTQEKHLSGISRLEYMIGRNPWPTLFFDNELVAAIGRHQLEQFAYEVIDVDDSGVCVNVYDIPFCLTVNSKPFKESEKLYQKEIAPKIINRVRREYGQ